MYVGMRYALLTQLQSFPADWKLTKVPTVRKGGTIHLLGYHSGVLSIRSPSTHSPR